MLSVKTQKEDRRQEVMTIKRQTSKKGRRE